MNRCRVCDRSLPRDHRTYCSQACRLRERQETISARLDEITFLLEVGESPDQIAARIGLTLYGITSGLYRYGHTDLANRLERVAQRERRRRMSVYKKAA